MIMVIFAMMVVIVTRKQNQQQQHFFMAYGADTGSGANDPDAQSRRFAKHIKYLQSLGLMHIIIEDTAYASLSHADRARVSNILEEWKNTNQSHEIYGWNNVVGLGFDESKRVVKAMHRLGEYWNHWLMISEILLSGNKKRKKCFANDIDILCAYGYGIEEPTIIEEPIPMLKRRIRTDFTM